jgi:hypothetical protein
MRSVGVAILLAVASMALPAQEGFPLDGTWRGERRAEGTSPVTFVIVMQWDGRTITGVINPGPKSLPLRDARLEPQGWRVTFAATSGSGEPITFAGHLDALGDYHRTVTGIWTEGGRRYDFRMSRE